MDNLLVTKIRQDFARPLIADLEQTIRHQMDKVRIPPGARIAITVGSRGIADVALITKTVVDVVKGGGGEPFLVPAMGSHGGATADGQCGILASYGVTEESMGCPVLATMDVVELDNTGLDVPLFMDKFAFESDGVILVNRIKPHTNYHGDFESGLLKMSVIGLGKERQANAIHSYGVHGLKTIMPLAGRMILSTGKIILGLGIVENAYDETAIIEALSPHEIVPREPEILAAAKRMMPCLPLEDIDVLIVDRLGKDISGSGIDPNIIGRMKIRGEPEPDSPQIKVIVVTDITEASHGNACGIGFADVTTRRLADKVDWNITYTNGVTSNFYEHIKLPVVAPTDAVALDWAIRACHDPVSPKKIVRIKDTLHLSELYLSQPALQAAGDRVTAAGAPVELFDSSGLMIPF